MGSIRRWERLWYRYCLWALDNDALAMTGPENTGAAPRGCALWGRSGPHLKIIHSGN